MAATEQAEEFVPKSNPKSDIEIAAANVAARAAAIKASQATAEPSAPSILSISNDKLQSLVDAWALPSPEDTRPQPPPHQPAAPIIADAQKGANWTARYNRDRETKQQRHPNPATRNARKALTSRALLLVQ